MTEILCSNLTKCGKKEPLLTPETDLKGYHRCDRSKLHLQAILVILQTMSERKLDTKLISEFDSSASRPNMVKWIDKAELV